MAYKSIYIYYTTYICSPSNDNPLYA